MHEANLRIIARLKRFVSSTSAHRNLLSRFCLSDQHFIRSRKLPFPRLVLLVMKLCKKSLSVELEKFFEETGESVQCSVSAFTQQRSKLKANFFFCWNKILQKSFYLYYGKAVKRWKGYRIVAGDGSSISLVNTPSLKKYFGGQSNQRTAFVLAKTFYHYDVLNELILHSLIKPYRCGEQNMAYMAVREIEEDTVMIYDRNFSSYKMIALHLWQKKEKKFIIRAKETQPMIKKFIESGLSSAIVEMLPTPAAITGLRKNGFLISPSTIIKIRLVRVELPKGIEVLITNLWQEDGHLDMEFKDLYFKRWGIETNISIQKNILQLEAFSGLTPHAVLQDFYATVMMANLHSILIKEAQQKVDVTVENRKYTMKINRNKSFGRLKINLVRLFVNHMPDPILKILIDQFTKDILPVRPGRSFPRIIKNPQSRSKYKTFSNFKPAY